MLQFKCIKYAGTYHIVKRNYAWQVDLRAGVFVSKSEDGQRE